MSTKVNTTTNATIISKEDARDKLILAIRHYEAIEYSFGEGFADEKELDAAYDAVVAAKKELTSCR